MCEPVWSMCAYKCRHGGGQKQIYTLKLELQAVDSRYQIKDPSPQLRNSNFWKALRVLRERVGGWLRGEKCLLPSPPA